MSYTYLITHIPTGKRYYGVRYAKNCDPSELGTKYFSSSKIVQNLIQQDGLDQFKFEVRKVFRYPSQAKLWESKVLHRLNVSSNEKYFNVAVNNATGISHPSIRKLVTEKLLQRDPAHFKKLGKKGYQNRSKVKSNAQGRWAAKSYEVTYFNEQTEIIHDLKAYAKIKGVRYDTLRACACTTKSYKSAGILRVVPVPGVEPR